MGKDRKKDSNSDQEAVARAVRRGFWNGLVEGFSGPLMMGMGAPRDAQDLKILSSARIAQKYASLANSSKEVGEAIQQAADDLMRNKQLVYRRVADKKVGSDGKYHTTTRVTVDFAGDDEPREQPRTDTGRTPRRG